MDAKKNKIVLLVSLFIVLLFGSFFFKDSVPASLQPEESPENFEGLLVAGNLDNGWQLLTGEMGEVLSLSEVDESKVSCEEDSDYCRDFLEKKRDLVGMKVNLEGFLEGKHVDVENLSLVEFSNFEYEFDQFPTDIEEPDSFEVDFSTRPEAESFRTRIRNTVDEGVNFAGSYSYAEWGCGTRCGAGAIVNPRSGEIVEYGIMNSHGTNFRKDSRLLIVNPSEEMEYMQEGDLMTQETSRYYLMNKGDLLLLCQK